MRNAETLRSSAPTEATPAADEDGLITACLLGINVAGIPGTEFRWAFLVVCLLLLGLGGAVLWLFRRARWL